ncbi:hypothetical protein EDD86DRAFT_213225 [Gorgonomyces haynaldii]|nr:hypothetical protein EDD86DRAFT_213225 [Gorgonomyces haynaldii]
MWQKIAANPKLSPFLSQPDVVTKLQQIQQNPQNIAMAMQDQRIMQIMVGLMGLDATVATNQDELEQQKREAEENLERKRQEEQKKEEPAPVVEEETEEKKKRAASDEHKALGNASYKKRQFDDALKHYDAAWAADDTNLAVLTNKSAVLFEMEKYDECIKVCEEAVDIGRSMRADFKLIARALARIGSAYVKKDDLEQAIKFFQKSLSEHRTADTLEKLREVETLKKKKDLEAYIDPKLADEAREEGNNLFKNHDYAGSVKLYTEAVKRNPKDARNFSNRAAAYMKLMALPEAEKDCDEAIRLDENFVKAYIRKAAIQFTKREFTRCIETCNLASLKDPEGKHAAEIQQQIQKAYLANGQDNENLTPEQRYKKAMQDPEVAKIMSDPIMQQILQQMQEDPKAARDHLKNPAIAAKIQTLINAGIISTR